MQAAVAWWIGELTINPIVSHRCGSSLARVTCEKVKFCLQMVWVLQFSPTFDEWSARYILERAVKLKWKKKFIYTERKKKRRVNFIPKFHSSLKKFVKYFTLITKRYMYGTKVPNFIGLWSTSLELLKFIGSYPPNLEIKIKLKINFRCAPLLLPLLP